MIHKDTQRRFVRELEDCMGVSSESVNRVALKLLDAGWPESEIIRMIDDVYAAGLEAGRWT